MNRIPMLEIDRASKHYRSAVGDLPVLQDLTLSVAEGEFISIVGASGCGKSTLLRLVVGLDDDYTGEIRLRGKKVRGTALERGIVFQEPRLLPWLTVRRNVAIGLLNSGLGDKEKAEIVADHIRLVRLEGFEDAYPHQLSGGMSQRVAIARALVNRPAVLLLDEPFGALDAMTRAHMQRTLEDIWSSQRVTMLLVTHDVEEAVFLGDRVVVMDARPGRVKRIVDVALPRPRRRAAADFSLIERAILNEFSDDCVAGQPDRTGESRVFFSDHQA
ncbi:sulfonate transport system ATP-binding protein [Paraburkholderia sp. JPY465]|uniref:ABC transporter ATP-binding protein n=1 Tax=Paraburkholderia sp. JPY465 TaxID=3042285 RepID=UPI003D21061F